MKKLLMLSIIISVFGLAACDGNGSQRSKSGKVIEWRGTDRTGIYNESGLLTSWGANGPELLWHHNGLGDGHSSPAIANGKIFVTGMTDDIGSIFVFDMNGKLLNTVEYGQEWDRNFNGARGTITPDGNNIFLISGLGVIYSFNQNTLELNWSKNFLEEFNASNIVWGITESPLIVGDKVIATPGGEQHNVVAVNKNTGELIWSTPGMGDQSAYCSPLFISDQQVPLIVQMTGHHTLGIHAETGEMLWAHENTNQHQVHANTPVYSNSMILITSGYGRGSTMLRLTNGGRGVEEVWFNELLDNRIGGMVKVGNYIYGSGDFSRSWFCVNWNTGEIMWQDGRDKQGIANGVTIANGDMLYIYTDRGDMILARATPEKFDIVSRFPITLGTDQHWAHPVIYDGVLYVRHGDTIMAYKIK
ncbi:MAG: PQQ-like beta-propeller repeat protein [Dysgonamonadaceae bacterium]|jgi:outer membrane protein assembly factor BamB|nr:PQQ-like beta-propeller repeat protein [Dysgonamonadaceae bacterium]